MRGWVWWNEAEEFTYKAYWLYYFLKSTTYKSVLVVFSLASHIANFRQLEQALIQTAGTCVRQPPCLNLPKCVLRSTMSMTSSSTLSLVFCSVTCLCKPSFVIICIRNKTGHVMYPWFPRSFTKPSVGGNCYWFLSTDSCLVMPACLNLPKCARGWG